ncbi:Putative flippase GtrA (transmembrane translocase of bactoprenol-linked glucose) [Paenibacillus sp. UNCCL117]|uniref:GtrA family protein n=1 Tax=unclassified Paenibacillus TaxID=185978 RepID=UPI000891D3C8|nr:MULTISPECIES: GtrA family protein [unclassified Paenibacillus]SDC17278.1 Putative flippase GtrA (transmembrane translocase of bactoprenol-linked glucose) [Paenibacillus sp. cl123]SFW17975.1 Putative flippase GtrA (transmembrane translocase of bactoprenol-linked glucose) [Paenibacillus sp. UNCCL117]
MIEVMRNWARSSLARFLLVGVLNTLIGLSIMLLLLHAAGLNYWLSTAAGTVIGACVSYLLNRTFTFRSSSSHGTAVLKFVAVLACCYMLAYAASGLAAKLLGGFFPALSAELGHTLAVVLGNGLYTLLNYAGQRYIVFAGRQGEN